MTVPAGEPPRVGETVRDTRRDLVGVVMGRLGRHLWLRPLGGGREWDVEPEALERLSRDEVLIAHLALVNARSRKGGP